jgi:hypothetical protein
MVAGIGIAVVFGLAEWRIAVNFEFYAAKTVTLGRLLNMSEDALERTPHATEWWLSATFLMLSIYVVSIGLWITTFFWYLLHGGLNAPPEKAAPNEPLQQTGPA